MQLKNDPGRPLSSEWIERLTSCVEDSWPLREIEVTFGVSHRTMKKHFPNYIGITPNEGRELGQLMAKVGLSL